MNIKAYRLHDRAVALQPAPRERACTQGNAAAHASLPDPSVNGHGWQLLCPCEVEAIWNGGPDATDVEIRLETAAAGDPGFVRSELGGGLLSFHPGYQFKTEGAHDLWVRGPINLPKDGLSPLESLVDTSRLPCTISVHWRFTRPNQSVRFAAGEPFGTILPYPKGYIEPCKLEVAGLEEALEAYEREIQRSLRAPAVQGALRRLQEGGELAAQPEAAAALERAAAGSAEKSAARWAARLVNPPPVSCICPTYGRVAPLEEAIQSFLRQDYPGQKELIVLNDYGRQTLALDHPEVRIINLARRFRTVGEKYKAAAALASHDLIFVWHDDDIYLPHRLSLSVARFAPQRGFFKADRAWFWNDGKLSGPDRNTFHGGCCWSRDLWVETPGYPHVGNGYDIGFEERCDDQRSGATVAQQVKPEDVYYIYRWAGTGSYHLSALGQYGHEHAQVAAYVERQAACGEIEQGPIQLNPHWQADYPALIQSHLRNLSLAKPGEAEVPFPPPFFSIPPPEAMPEDLAATLFRGTHPARISVILPALNESVLLQRTVEQFTATLPADSEVIVVDNGSTDGSADFLLGPPREGVTLIRSPKPLGVAGARNRGLEAARGEVVVFADAHVDVPERWWQAIVATLNRPHVGVVAPGLGVMGRPELSAACGQRIAERNLRLQWLAWKQREPHPVPTLGGGFMAMRRETLDVAGGFDEGMPQWGSEDVELCLRYWLLGYEAWVVPEVTVLHYFRQVNPLRVKSGVVTHNVLRVALLHFNLERIARVVGELQKAHDFGPALARAVESDVWQRRRALASRRVRDDDWLFATFTENFSV
jgi:glycosyltransferase involved in cell wall biosynthesis